MRKSRRHPVGQETTLRCKYEEEISPCGAKGFMIEGKDTKHKKKKNTNKNKYN